MVEGARLERVCAETHREFESHSLRHFLNSNPFLYSPLSFLKSLRLAIRTENQFFAKNFDLKGDSN